MKKISAYITIAKFVEFKRTLVKKGFAKNGALSIVLDGFKSKLYNSNSMHVEFNTTKEISELFSTFTEECKIS